MSSATLLGLFKQDPTRPIEGVIKADDDAHLATEISEYVVTKDIGNLLERKFIDAYLDPAGEKVNGVWISGFFGSGKSHLLKMLSLVLRNAELKTEAGDKLLAGDTFLTKVTHSELLQAGLRTALQMKTESILFNIDSKAQVVTKRRDDDAVVRAFLMQFNAHCGYYSGLPYVAQLERDLDEEGLWDSFRQNYQALYGRPWREGRERIILNSTEFETAYAKTKGIPAEQARGIVARYAKEFAMSIDGFAKIVARYLDKRKAEKGVERLNFFVDEVGQYISDNTKLMTNLQTIAENLFTATNGRAWVFVTSQEAIDDVIGQWDKDQAHDFSKIQARFASKLNLQSSNVDEVIEERLLKKTPAAKEQLMALYGQYETKLKSAYAFSEDSRTVSYRDAEHFARTYPFVPYQFPLFSEVLKQLSTNNAFTGKHSSVGERSMLGVAQEVIKGMIGREGGGFSAEGGVASGEWGGDTMELASFDRMYEGIKSTLRSEVTGTLLFAESRDISDFEKRVLKVLFLVKWLDQRFTATAENVAILMLERLDQNIAEHKERVTKALDKLERVRLIQRNGLVYNFLTDEERNVEAQIKDIDVSLQSMVDRVQTFVFGDVIPERKYRYSGNGQTYAVGQMFDGRQVGREQDLKVHVTSEHFVDAGNFDRQKMMTLDQPEIRIVLPDSPELFREIRTEIQTTNYLERNPVGSADARLEPILRDHGTKNRSRRAEVEARLRSLLQEARIIVSGKYDKVYSGLPKQRVGEAFDDLIKTIYTDLELLGKHFDAKAEIDKLKTAQPSALFADSVLSQAEQAVLDHLNLMKSAAHPVTLENLFKRFAERPYGWVATDTAGLVARLVARHLVELRVDGSELSGPDASLRLNNSQRLDSVRVELADVVDNTKVQALKNLHKELFAESIQSKESKVVRERFAEALKTHLAEVQGQLVLAKAESLPFAAELDAYAEAVRTYVKTPSHEYFDRVREMDDALTEVRQEVYGPIKTFLQGPARQVYSDLKTLHASAQPNRGHLADGFFADLDATLGHARPYAGGLMTRADATLRDTKQRVGEALTAERKTTRAEIEEELAGLQGLEEWEHLSEGKRGYFRDKLQHRMRDLEDRRTIGDIRLMRPSISPGYYHKLENEVAGTASAERNEREAQAAKAAADVSQPTVRKQTSAEANYSPPEPVLPQVNDPVVGYVSLSELTGGRHTLKTIEEVDDFLKQLRNKMIEQINEQRGISVR